MCKQCYLFSISAQCVYIIFLCHQCPIFHGLADVNNELYFDYLFRQA